MQTFIIELIDLILPWIVGGFLIKPAYEYLNPLIHTLGEKLRWSWLRKNHGQTAKAFVSILIIWLFAVNFSSYCELLFKILPCREVYYRLHGTWGHILDDPINAELRAALNIEMRQYLQICDIISSYDQQMEIAQIKVFVGGINDDNKITWEKITKNESREPLLDVSKKSLKKFTDLEEAQDRKSRVSKLIDAFDSFRKIPGSPETIKMLQDALSSIHYNDELAMTYEERKILWSVRLLVFPLVGDDSDNKTRIDMSTLRRQAINNVILAIRNLDPSKDETETTLREALDLVRKFGLSEALPDEKRKIYDAIGYFDAKKEGSKNAWINYVNTDPSEPFQEYAKKNLLKSAN